MSSLLFPVRSFLLWLRPGFRPDFVLSEDLKHIPTLVALLDECVSARGPGEGLELHNGKPTFAAPRGCYELIKAEVGEAGERVAEARSCLFCEACSRIHSCHQTAVACFRYSSLCS